MVRPREASANSFLTDRPWSAPTSLTSIGIDSALATFAFVLRLTGANGLKIPTALMMTRFPTHRLSASERESVEILQRCRR